MEHVADKASTSSNHEKEESSYEPKNVFHAMSHAFRDPDNDSDSSCDDLREKIVAGVRNQEVQVDEHLFFGPYQNSGHLLALHPEPIQIFRLWQVYIDNVNPLLKVSHVNSLQTRIIEAASNLINIDPDLEALIFSIYCMSILSLSTQDCQTMFGSSKKYLLSRYQLGCRQALWNCDFLQTNNLDCLIALFLYLISIRPDTTRQSLASMLAIAIRLAQRMGIQSEKALANFSPFDAEMRRRLWWSLVLFDTRMSELAGSGLATLDPTWDCRIPLNVNDVDLRLDMKVLPAARTNPTDAVFAVIRSELGEYLRHAAFHLHIDSSAFKALVKQFDNALTLDNDRIVQLRTNIEDRYLKFCDHGNPVHFMASWTAKVQLAKYHLMEQNFRLSSSTEQRVDMQLDTATGFALEMLECDTVIMTAPLTKGFIWLHQINFPFPAYYQVTQDLRRRPTMEKAQHAWNVMSDNWEAWFHVHFSRTSAIFQLLTKLILQAWEACEPVSTLAGQKLTTPKIVSSIQDALARIASDLQNLEMEEASISTNLEINEFPLSHMPPALVDSNMSFGLGSQSGHAWTPPGMSFVSNPLGQIPLGGQMTHTDWTAYGGQPGW
ncbi:hypothetical protein LTR84_007964 [Exophiala bonariae]|uniref:Xylanolytic transcriptional activator regulatory domain-containing protein n=1 Tax=Exophiala bonariae TaxID=1690606 RepID=A0AAV9NLK0_9EURO|nr:hypothetical protein LTR84_007964 [Exophiala bonariae]